MTNISKPIHRAVPAGTLLVLLASLNGVADAQSGASTTAAAKPVNVKVSQPVRKPLKRTVRLPGTLTAYEQVDIMAKVSGYVDEVKVDIGAAVSKGQPLITLSIPEMAEELQRAESVVEAQHAKGLASDAQAAQAKQNIEIAKSRVGRFVAQQHLAALNLKRKADLREGNAIPEQMLDEARAAVEIADAQLAIARAEVAGATAVHASAQADRAVAHAEAKVAAAELARLRTLMNYATLTAPFDGVITMRKVDPGAFVRSAAEGATAPLLTIAKVNRLRLVLNVPEIDVPYVRPGTTLQFHARALGDTEQSASVTRIASALDSGTRTMRAEADLDNSDGALTPGMYAQVTVNLELKASAMLVPARAIRTHEGTSSVLVASNGVALTKVIRLGYDDGIWSEILEGLDGSEQVIVTAAGTVLAGTRIHVANN